jgi:hypothetical protein
MGAFSLKTYRRHLVLSGHNEFFSILLEVADWSTLAKRAASPFLPFLRAIPLYVMAGLYLMAAISWLFIRPDKPLEA